MQKEAHFKSCFGKKILFVFLPNHTKIRIEKNLVFFFYLTVLVSVQRGPCITYQINDKWAPLLHLPVQLSVAGAMYHLSVGISENGYPVSDN